MAHLNIPFSALDRKRPTESTLLNWSTHHCRPDPTAPIENSFPTRSNGSYLKKKKKDSTLLNKTKQIAWNKKLILFLKGKKKKKP